MHEPIPHICNWQYRKHNLKFYKKIMENQITIQKENVLDAYNQASEEQKTLLENLFGEEMVQPKDIRERIKTFDDACEELGEDHQYVKAYTGWMSIYHTDCKDVTAYLRLRIICAALNEGWNPTFSKDECRYFPWFNLYTKEQYLKLDDKEKRYCVLRSGNNTNSYCGFVRCSAFVDASNPNTGNGSRLALKTREIAEYCGNQFIDIWADFLFA